MRVDAAESSLRRPQGRVAVVDGLASLTDKGLRASDGDDDEPRFTMLETIREYAVSGCGESGEAEELRRRHARTSWRSPRRRSRI